MKICTSPKGTLKNGNPSGDPSKAPRCGAKTRKRTACMAPAMKNGRCRLHGGLRTGPKTLEGLERSRKANFKHGRYSPAYQEELRKEAEWQSERETYRQEILA